MSVNSISNLILGGPGGSGESPFVFDPLVVELRSRPGDEPEILGWLGHEGAVAWPVNALPTAMLPIALADGFGVNIGTAGHPSYRTIDELVDDGKIITIRTAREEPDTDFVLFEGRVDRIGIAAHPKSKTARLSLTHIGDELITEERYHFRGQVGLTLKDYEAIEADAGAKVWPRAFTSLDCIFNPNGTANGLRQKVLLQFGAEDGGKTFPLAVFCDPYLPDRNNAKRVQAWTWGRVLLYIIYWSRQSPAAGKIGECTQFRFSWPVVQTGENTVEDFVDYMESGGRFDQDADESGGADNPLDAALLAKPVSHAIEGRNWIEALDWTCIRSGISYVWESLIEKSGLRTWRIKFFVPGQHAGRFLKLPSPQYRTHDKSWATVRENADLTDFDIERDYGQAMNVCEVAGGPMLREVTARLAPGWKVNDDWDPENKTEADIQKMIDAIGTEAWKKKYVLGSGGIADVNRSAGRLWVLNTLGAYSSYGRGYGPFKSAGYLENGDWQNNYELVNLDKFHLAGKDAGGNAISKHNAVRARPFKQCLSGPIPRASFPVLVEWSGDSGVTWLWLQAGVNVSQTDARIEITEQDLSTLVWKDGKSFPEKYIRGKLRIRVTGVWEIEDSFAHTEYFADSLSNRVRKSLLQKRDEFQLNLRDGEKDKNVGNSIFNQKFEGHNEALNYPARERNNTIAARGFANRMLKTQGRVTHRGPVELPELVFPYTIGDTKQGWQPGDVIEGIQAESGADRWHSLKFLARDGEDAGADGVVIAAVSWQWKQPAGDEGFGVGTRLMLEDVTRFIKFEGR